MRMYLMYIFCDCEWNDDYLVDYENVCMRMYTILSKYISFLTKYPIKNLSQSFFCV